MEKWRPLLIPFLVIVTVFAGIDCGDPREEPHTVEYHTQTMGTRATLKLVTADSIAAA